MKTVFAIIMSVTLMASCMSSKQSFEARSYDTSNNKWKPVKDKTPYYKVIKGAERD